MRRVALLRGVNVGGKAKVAMPALKSLFEEVGCKNVQTYIQSGNVVFEAPAALNAKKLGTAIEKHFKLKVSVTLRTHAQLPTIIGAYPYPDTDAVHVAFLMGKPKLSGIDTESLLPEEFTHVGNELFFHLPNGMGVAKLPAYVGRRIGVDMTVRNWRTVNKLIELSS
jgi:uncharacterized protein (DUF1697 family)